MIVLVPVSRFRVKYEVAGGVPYSQLHRLVLQAVSEGIASKDELVETFQIHPRLLIESLVTLTYAGWVALGGSHTKQFVLTPEGQQAVKKNQLPESIVVSSRHTFVLLERVTGAVIPEGEVRYVPKKVLKDKRLWESCMQLPAEILDNRLDESQVQLLLPRQQGQRLHWVGPIDMVSKGNHYIPVSVDPESESIVNLPQRCENRLRPSVLEIARKELSRRAREKFLTWEGLTQVVNVGHGRVSTAPGTSDLPRRDWPILWAPDDLLLTPNQHTELLHQVLGKAQTSVLITSSVVEFQCLEQLKPAILKALRRDIDIDLLWGYANGGESLEWMKKLAYDAKRDNIGGKLRYNRASAFSNAKMILWDEGGGNFRGAVGSYDWLAHGFDGDQRERSTQYSIRVSHPAILSILSWCAAGLWSGSHLESLSSVPDRWRWIATDLEARGYDAHDGTAADDTDRAIIRIIFDREHPTLLREWTATAQARLLIGAAKLDTTAKQQLLSACEHNRAPGFTYQVLYGQSDLEEEAIELVRQTVVHAAGMLRCVPQMGANIIVSDRSACISSFSFLSQPSHAREVGLVIEGTGPANQIASHLLSLVS